VEVAFRGLKAQARKTVQSDLDRLAGLSDTYPEYRKNSFEKAETRRFQSFCKLMKARRSCLTHEYLKKRTTACTNPKVQTVSHQASRLSRMLLASMPRCLVKANQKELNMQRGA